MAGRWAGSVKCTKCLPVCGKKQLPVWLPTSCIPWQANDALFIPLPPALATSPRSRLPSVFAVPAELPCFSSAWSGFCAQRRARVCGTPVSDSKNCQKVFCFFFFFFFLSFILYPLSLSFIISFLLSFSSSLNNFDHEDAKTQYGDGEPKNEITWVTRKLRLDCFEAGHEGPQENGAQ